MDPNPLMPDSFARLQRDLASRYRLIRVIGAGGMATVYLAEDLKHHRQVAVKVLKPDLAAMLGVERFLREIRVAAQLHHPNILALYDSGDAGGSLFYVMPFVDGESLRARLQREIQLPIDDAVMLAREIAAALHAAHSRGIIHRDIKPDNVLLLESHALVADFGIAHAVDQGSTAPLTGTGVSLGTPRYMSPEQASGGTPDSRSDIYSLGCVLYEMLVGQPPFDAPTPGGILARHAAEALPSLRLVRPTIPEQLERVVQRALAKAPADRFRSAKEMGGALDLEDISAPRQPSRSETSASGSRGRRWLVVGGAGLLVAGAAGLLLSSSVSGRRSTAREDDAARRVAVEYFETGTGLDSIRHLADGLTESLIEDLPQLTGLQVISSRAVGRFRGGPIPLDTVVREMNAALLVRGLLSIEEGGRVRLHVTLVDPHSGDVLDRVLLVRQRSEILGLREDLIRMVAESLRRPVGSEVSIAALPRATPNARAWELVQKAEALSKDAEVVSTAQGAWGSGQSGRLEAARHLRRAADSVLRLASAMDPTWATPLIKRGRLIYQDCRLALPKRALAEPCVRHGLDLAARAIRLDSSGADGLELRGALRYIRYLSNRELDSSRARRLIGDAEEDLRAAVAARPNQAEAWSILSHLLMQKGDAQAQSARASARAYEADPYLPGAAAIVSRAFILALEAGDQSEAAKWCGEGRRRFANDARFVLCGVQLLALPGAKPDIPAAWKLAERYADLSSPDRREYWGKRAAMIVAMALVRAGLRDSARRVMVRARADAAVDPFRELVYLEARGRGMLGDKDEAFSLLADYLSSDPSQTANLAQDSSWWTRELRADPRWKTLTEVAR